MLKTKNTLIIFENLDNITNNKENQLLKNILYIMKLLVCLNLQYEYNGRRVEKLPLFYIFFDSVFIPIRSANIFEYFIFCKDKLACQFSFVTIECVQHLTTFYNIAIFYFLNQELIH